MQSIDLVQVKCAAGQLFVTVSAFVDNRSVSPDILITGRVCLLPQCKLGNFKFQSNALLQVTLYGALDGGAPSVACQF